jgi:Coenzyme PQQ synthesis protein D (PqqD)
VKTDSHKARKRSLIIKELPDETLVYDLETDKAHCLNQTVALVWRNCDGKRTVAELQQLIEKELGSPAPQEMAWLALDELEKFNLLETTEVQSARLSSVTRRQMIRAVGGAAIAIPLITSILAPPPAQAATLLPPGACCNSPGQCNSNSCSQNPACTGQPSTKACD